MAITGDYHTHTIYSRRKFFPYFHAKGTIEENVVSAKNKGLKEVAITDHGFNHKFFCTYRDNLDKLKKECVRLSQKYDMNVLLGVESNIISMDGDIDVNNDDYKKLDSILCGFHKCVIAKSNKDKKLLFARNKWARLRKSDKYKKENTAVFIKVIQKNNIDIITHLKQDIAVDPIAIAKEAVKKGTLIELNNKHYHFTDEELIGMAKTGVKFIINSDAHKPSRIGGYENVIDIINRLNISKTQIVNWDKLPEFINYKRKK